MVAQLSAKSEVGGVEVIEKLMPRWQQLCEQARSAPFQRPEWVAAYVRAFEPNREVVLLTAEAEDRLVAVLPLVRRKCFYAGLPLIKLAGAANVHSVSFDIVAPKGELGEAAIPAMWNLLRRTPGWHMLELPLISEAGATAKLLRLAAGDGHHTVTLLAQRSPVIRFHVNGDGGPAQIVDGPSRHFRHELRRYARIFTEQLGEAPQVLRCAEPKPELLRQFFELEEAGWKGKKGSAINSTSETRAFYQQIARGTANSGQFCLHTLTARNIIVAGAFSLSTNEGFFPLKIAHDESLRRMGPGHLLFEAIVKECAEQRIPKLFFGGTDEHYKSLWTKETVPSFTGFVFSKDVRSNLAYQIRNCVLSPLGRLRVRVRQQVRAESHGSKASAPRRRNSKPAPLTTCSSALPSSSDSETLVTGRIL